MTAETTPRKCSRCVCAASPSHTLCPHCRRKVPCQKWTPPTGTGRGTNGTIERRPADPVVLVPIASYNPFPGGVPADLPPWTAPYLIALAETGKDTLSANTAGVPVRVVRILRSLNPRFAEAVEDATAFYLDRLEASLPGTSKPIGTIARLKADRADRFESALIVQKANAFDDAPPPPGLEKLMEDWWENPTPATLASLAQDHSDPGAAALWASLPPEQQAAAHRHLAELTAATAGDVIVEVDGSTGP